MPTQTFECLKIATVEAADQSCGQTVLTAAEELATSLSNW
jgi:hypothetical protein